MSMVLPEEYNQTNDMTSVGTKRHIDKYRQLLKWKTNESILEFAFGDGGCSEKCLQPILPEDYEEFVILDISEKMIKFAKNKVKIPRVRFVLEDIANENISKEFDSRFDHIFGFFAMHHINNPSKGLKNIYKMLKPGGQIFLTFFERKPNDEGLANLAEHPKWKKYGNHTSPYYYKDDPKSVYEQDLDEAGFKDYIFDVLPETYQFNDVPTWKRLSMSVNPAMAYVPKDEVEEYSEAYINELRNSRFVNLNGVEGKQTVTLLFNMFIVIASKTE